METINVKKVEDLSDAREIRRKVFQIEQGVSEESDFDGYDDNSDQFVVYIGKKAVGTLRVRYFEKEFARIERVAVLKECRGERYWRKTYK
ncbi:MAG: GNAT family N-acetyltransferase, partial [Candidatus Pacebacteria bacterium]|nr:GNAT family N-acetyltransferase [Candidatus Paceibacterota bacterium]